MRKILLILLVPLFLLSCKKNNLASKFKLTNSESYYPKNEWINELNYEDTNLFNTTIRTGFDEPQLEVEFNDKSFPLTFDFGNSKRIMISTMLENEIDYTIVGEGESLWPDGSFRGNIYFIEIPEMKLLNKQYYNVIATLEDWEIYSSEPFNGCVSMDYFKDLRFTLDYKQKLFACICQPFPYNTSTNNYLKIDLIQFDYHPYGVHFMGEVNNVKSIIYFDTGRSKTMIDRNLVESNKIISDKSGTYYEGNILIKFDELEFELQFPRVDDLGGAIDYDYPVGVAVGSDVLKYFVLTIDRTNNSDVLIIHR